MHVTGWRRTVAAVLAAWTAWTVGPMPVHACPEHDALAAHAAAPMHHAHGHAMHHGGAPAHHDAHHGCTCPGCCDAASAAVPPLPVAAVHPFVFLSTPRAVAVADAPPHAEPRFLRPPSVGPPTLRA
jgi:hypothetical protein